MNDIADLRSYYEREADLGLRIGPKGWRIEIRDDFVRLLGVERRRSVVDFGAGPGVDLDGFSAADLRSVGIDLAHGNCALAASAGLTVVNGSIAAPPFRPRSFDAGWSMSVLMHVPEDRVESVLRAMAESLRPGAPLMIGIWGGDRRDTIDEQIAGERRLFSLRPHDRNRGLLESVGEIEHASVTAFGPDRWEYQTFLVRIR